LLNGNVSLFVEATLVLLGERREFGPVFVVYTDVHCDTVVPHFASLVNGIPEYFMGENENSPTGITHEAVSMKID
jgi:hypothetical protein